ncbi:tetratricopeptide repeat protein [Blastopirellula marina]|uniref:Tetratricopeptide repeat protein n=1 Tax=Blastopirellula marina TaxID=124 RepID=A0A2S8G171_9BACT|nr:tetratricopeptide repeat protein [Blastopirellula marina]PQO38060.1 hypothetical protein C5Y98_08220 [Blastopirellula marina]PTL44716.1 tetratricopeptide repeat protein [Blastopirellula marina]
MRTLNVRLLLFLLVGLAIFGGIVHAIHEYQSSNLGTAFLRSAERAIEEKEFGTAIQDIEKYLILNTDDSEATARLGLLLASHGSQQKAFFALERALRMDDTRNDVRRELVDVAIRVGRFSDAKTHLQEHLLKESPEDGELLVLLAQCQVAEGDFKGAAKSLESAIQFAPESVPAYLQLVQILHGSLDRPSEALAIMDQMVANNPNSPDAYIARGNYVLRYRNTPDIQAAKVVGLPSEATVQERAMAAVAVAESDAEKGLELAPESLQGLILAAACAQEQGKFDIALTHLELALKLAPDSPAVHTRLADLAIHQNNPQEAIGRFKEGIKVCADKRDLLWNLSNLLTEQNQLKEAKEFITQLSDTDQPKSTIAYLETRLLVSEGEWLAGAEQLEQLRPALTQWPDLEKQAELYLGECYRQLGKTDLELTAFRRAVTIDPFWLPARLGVAQSLLSLGRMDEALQEFEYAAHLPGATTEILLDLARLEILRNLRQSPSQRNWANSERILAEVEKLTPDSTSVPILRAEMSVAQGDNVKAEQLLLKAKEVHPDQITIWMTLVALAQRENDLEKAQSILQEAKQKLGDSATIRLAEGRIAILTDKESAKEKLRMLAENDTNLEASEVLQLKRGLANLALAIGDFENAEKLCTQLAELEPNNLSIHLLLFDLALMGDRNVVFQSALDSIHRIEGNGPLWRYGEAVRLMAKGRDGDSQALAAAEKQLAEARVARPAWSRIPLLMAEIDEAQSDLDGSVRHYLEAIELGERNPRAVSRLVRLLYQQKRYVEADQVIRRLQEQRSPFSGDMVRMAADISLRLDDFDRALELAQDAATNSKDYRDHLWLAQVLGVQERNKESEEKFRYAIELAPDAPEVWVGYVGFLARSKQESKAQAVIAEAKEALSRDKASLALASCYETLKQLDSAEEHYKKAIGSSPKDIEVLRRIANFYLSQGNATEALSYLEDIISQGSEVEADDLNWSRRNLAIAIGMRGNREGFERAMSLLDENLKFDPRSTSDKRAKAILLANRGESSDRAQAIQLFEQVLKEQSEPPANDVFLLANLRLAESEYLRSVKRQTAEAGVEWSKARRLMQGLLAANPDEPRYIQAYVDALLRQGENYEAALWLEQLETNVSTNSSFLALQVRVLIANDRYQDVIQVLRKRSSELEKEDTFDPKATLTLAQILEGTGSQLEKNGKQDEAIEFFSEAEKLYKRVGGNTDMDPLVVAGFLARRERFDEALEIASKTIDDLAPEQIANFAMNITRQREPAALDGLERFLQETLVKHNNSYPILSVLADVHALQGRNDDAEKDYRRMLSKSPNDIVVLNNLGFLLALKQEHLDEAKACIDRAIELAGPRTALLDTRGTILSAAGDHLQAIKDLQKAVDENPSPVRLFHLAIALQRTGNRSTAASVLEKAKEHGLDASQFYPLERELYHKLEASL